MKLFDRLGVPALVYECIDEVHQVDKVIFRTEHSFYVLDLKVLRDGKKGKKRHENFA